MKPYQAAVLCLGLVAFSMFLLSVSYGREWVPTGSVGFPMASRVGGEGYIQAWVWVCLGIVAMTAKWVIARPKPLYTQSA